MIRFSRVSLLKACLCAAVISFAPSVNANPINPTFAIKIFEDATLIATIQDNDFQGGLGDLAFNTDKLIQLNNVYGDFSLVGVLSFTTSPGGTFPNPSGGFLSISSFSVQNLGAGAHTLNLLVSSQDFTVPAPNVATIVQETASGTLAAGAVTSNSTGWADNTNALFGTGFSSGTNVFNPPFNGGDSWSGTKSNGLFSYPSGAYSLTLNYNLTLGAGTALTGINANVRTLPAVPAPGALALALAGLPCLGLGWLRRRTK